MRYGVIFLKVTDNPARTVFLIQMFMRMTEGQILSFEGLLIISERPFLFIL